MIMSPDIAVAGRVEVLITGLLHVHIPYRHDDSWLDRLGACSVRACFGLWALRSGDLRSRVVKKKRKKGADHTHTVQGPVTLS